MVNYFLPSICATGLPCVDPDEFGAQIARVLLVTGIVVDIFAFILGLGLVGLFKPTFPGHVLACFMSILAGKCTQQKALSMT